MFILLRICLLFICFWSTISFAVPAPLNQAFAFDASPQHADTLQLHWAIKAHYFLYQQRIHVESLHKEALHIGDITFPKPEIKINKLGQQVLIYRNELSLSVPILSDFGGEYLVNVHYQGCSDDGFCYPPQTRTLKVSFNSEKGLSLVSQEQEIVTIPQSDPDTLTTTPPSVQAQSLLSTAHPIWIMLSFFGFGLLLAFTPCVLPMIPVISGIIVGHGQDISTRKAFLLSLSYVLSMSFTYGLIGAVIAKLGANLQVIVQSPWVISSFSIVFVLLALSMFNYYEFRLPLSWQSKLANITRSQSGGHYLGAAIMGAMSILILSPCVTPPLIGALSYISEADSPLLGLFALFFLGLGMGTPLLLIGASAGTLLPKTGQWMDSIKRFFGVLLLGLAIHLMSRLISPIASMLLWSALCIFSGLGLRPFAQPSATSRTVLPQVLGLMLLAFGIFILYGASAGHTNPLQPLASEPNEHNAYQDTPHVVVHSLPETLDALHQAKQNHKPAILDFYATWCDSCQHIENVVLRDPAISATQDKIIMIQVDLSHNDQATRDILAYFKVIAPPTFIFYDALGNARPSLQWEGMIDVDTLGSRIQQVIHHS